ncbi:MAG: hypothetical protein Q9219_005866 [cf. Caloplaca sp. 3 TL-2023]
MEADGNVKLPSPSNSDVRESTSSFYSTRSSISSFYERYPSKSHSYRPRLEVNAQQSIADLRRLLDILFTTQIPGPKLIRLQRKFCTPLGHGGQANVYAASADFEQKALAVQSGLASAKTKYSAKCWTKCVVKHLRADQRRNDIQHAFREIRRLCTPSLRNHPNIVRLVSWGMSLDALEAANLDTLSTPLLILEKAHCDLAQFIRGETFHNLPFEALCGLCQDVGRGLAAIHAAGIVHGDLKLENILIFSKERPDGTQWTAKICDFGSAVPTSADSDESTTYLGSDTWLPPECFEKLLVGQPLPQPLVPCDIFVYGLVVWAVFVGIPFSPLYKIQKAEGHGADIVRHMGQQRFYARAKASVTAYFSPSRSNVHHLLAAFTDQTFSHFSRSEDYAKTGYRQRSRFLVPDGGTSKDSGNRIRQILMVLVASLNDSPHRRELQPWHYFDYKNFPFPLVDSLPRFTPKYEFINRGEDTFIPFQYVRRNTSWATRVNVSMKRLALPRWSGLGRNIWSEAPRKRALAHVQSQIRKLQPRQQRYNRYRIFLRNFMELIPEMRGLGPFDTLEHPPDSPHYQFGTVEEALDQWLLAGRYSVGLDRLYAYARFRSHFRLCCWQAFCDRYPEKNNFVIKQWLGTAETPIDIASLAWLCRGDIGQYELQDINENPSSLACASSFFSKREFSDSMKVGYLLLLLEKGLDICRSHPTGEGKINQRTVFMTFLQHLNEPVYALDVARHFQRISMDTTTSPAIRYYMSGRSDDLDTQDDLEALYRVTITTALHDAVRAKNYALVEYLVTNQFNVSAPDSQKQTALDLALAATSRPSEILSIQAFLRQSLDGRSTAGDATAPPMGWEEISYDSDRSIAQQSTTKRTNPSSLLMPWRRDREEGADERAWQETSIEGNFDAITFLRPKTGLYQSDRLPLGRIQGEKQVYHLDPIRFLKKRNDTEPALAPATKPFFDEEWYRQDLQELERTLPMDWFNDERAYIRYPSQGLRQMFLFQRGWILALAVFASLSFLARTELQRTMELACAAVAIGLFSFGRSATSVRVEPLRPETLDYEGTWSGQAHLRVLWSNAPEILIGICAVLRGQTTLAKSVLIGFMLYDSLWIMGITICAMGIRHREILFRADWQMIAKLCLWGSSLVTMLLVFHLSASGTMTGLSFTDETIFVSRSTSIVSLLLWGLSVLFRNYTHAYLFDVEHVDSGLADLDMLTLLDDSGPPAYRSDDGDPVDPTLEERTAEDEHERRALDPSPAEDYLQTIVRLALLGLCADNFAHSIIGLSSFAQKLLVYFALPLATRLWPLYRCIRLAWMPSGFIDSNKETADSSIGSLLNSLLFVGPFLVLLGWVNGVPMDLQFTPVELIALDLATWLINYIFMASRANYLGGIMLIALYILSAFALYFST